MGRYLQPDPLGLAGSYNNLYSYAFQNPVNFSDPSGLSIEDDANSLQENLLQGLGPEEDALADVGSDLVHEAEAFPDQVADAEAGLSMQSRDVTFAAVYLEVHRSEG